MILDPIPQRAEAKNIWQQLLGPKFTEQLIAEAHRDAEELRDNEHTAASTQ